ncbi:hypothetical protein [Cellulomonas sp. Root137]|uniref:hypothetical protein n=1 Tax=Cellulomonas sp. Root137 TaxID=1736459 RepID=UPI0006FF9753|nr:hypothetical protein [Cellulomonas sp. Root137]KQY43807.1 hypothetical protein ASD18_15720 [Cellulomonas sp. Root137]
MWAFLFRRVRLFLIAAILLPVVASLARRLAERLEKDGPTRVSRGLHLIEGTAYRARSVLR